MFGIKQTMASYIEVKEQLKDGPEHTVLKIKLEQRETDLNNHEEIKKFTVSDNKINICAPFKVKNSKSKARRKRLKPVGPLRCDICTNQYSDKYQMRQHMMKHYEQMLYSCTICHKKFKQLANLRTHERFHVGDKPYVCGTCGKAFTMKYDLKRHEKMHTGEKLSCDFCPRQFTTQYLLNLHLKAHKEGAKIYACSLCHKEYATETTLKMHQLLHNDETLFQCVICGFHSTSKGNLNIHMRRHTKEKPYSCTFCNKSFTTSSDCKRHSQIHTREKPYRCGTCYRSFKNNNDLLRHSFLHSGENPCTCRSCGRTYSVFSYLKKHSCKSAAENSISSGKELRQVRKKNGKKSKSGVSREKFKANLSVEIPGLSKTEQNSVLGTSENISTDRSKIVEEKSDLLFSEGVSDITYIVDKKHTLDDTKQEDRSYGDKGSSDSKTINNAGHYSKISVEKDADTALKKDSDTALKKESETAVVKESYTAVEEELETSTMKDSDTAIEEEPGMAVSNESEHLKHISVTATEKLDKREDSDIQMFGECAAPTDTNKENVDPFEGKSNKHKRQRKPLNLIEIHKCDICSKQYHSKESIRRHIMRHFGQMPYKCILCAREFTDLAFLRVHIQYHTGDKPYLCSICGKSFTMKHDLKQHMLRHNGQKTFQCEVCSKFYLTKSELSSHLKTHKVKKPRKERTKSFACSECDRKYYMAKNLKAHMRLHSDDPTFICVVCWKRNTSLANLRLHMRTHTQEKPFSCNLCPLKFALSSSLLEHKRIHTGEAPYKCETCGKTFKRSGIWRQHMHIHLGLKREEPISCDICGRTYSQSSYYKKHKCNPAARNEKSFGCEACGRRYSQKRYFKRHKYRCPGKPAGENIVSVKTTGKQKLLEDENIKKSELSEEILTSSNSEDLPELRENEQNSVSNSHKNTADSQTIQKKSESLDILGKAKFVYSTGKMTKPDITDKEIRNKTDTENWGSNAGDKIDSPLKGETYGSNTDTEEPQTNVREQTKSSATREDDELNNNNKKIRTEKLQSIITGEITENLTLVEIVGLCQIANQGNGRKENKQPTTVANKRKIETASKQRKPELLSAAGEHNQCYTIVEGCNMSDIWEKQFGNIQTPKHQQKESKYNSCEICGKSFKLLTDLKRHILIHSAERPFRCDLCSYTCNRESSLKNHYYKHSGVKPYKCHCGKAFPEKGHLNRHMLVHTKERPYHCSLCGKSLTRLDSLKKHKALHLPK